MAARGGARPARAGQLAVVGLVAAVAAGLSACSLVGHRAAAPTATPTAVIGAGIVGDPRGNDIGKPFPVVVGAYGHEPRVSRGVGPPPIHQVELALIAGAGPVLPRGVAPVIRYVRVDWVTGAIAHNSWAEGIEQDSLPTDPVGINLASQLDTFRVGSRVEVLVPYGSTAAVYVIDIDQASRP